MPLEWCSNAQMEAISKFGQPNLSTSQYAIYFASQANCIKQYVLEELKKVDPTLRLVFCSSAIGMGFDSPCVVRIIHAKPPRRMVDFQQQIGRAGRQGQQAIFIVYYDARDLSQDMEASMKEYCVATTCLRLSLLKSLGFHSPAQQLTRCLCCSVCAMDCVCGNCGCHV